MRAFAQSLLPCSRYVTQLLASTHTERKSMEMCKGLLQVWKDARVCSPLASHTHTRVGTLRYVAQLASLNAGLSTSRNAGRFLPNSGEIAERPKCGRVRIDFGLGLKFGRRSALDHTRCERSTVCGAMRFAIPRLAGTSLLWRGRGGGAPSIFWRLRRGRMRPTVNPTRGTIGVVHTVFESWRGEAVYDLAESRRLWAKVWEEFIVRTRAGPAVFHAARLVCGHLWAAHQSFTSRIARKP